MNPKTQEAMYAEYMVLSKEILGEDLAEGLTEGLAEGLVERIFNMDSEEEWTENPTSLEPFEDNPEVVCVSNLGIEDGFDEGITYVAEDHEDDEMIYVYDRNGEKRELLAERFEAFVGAGV